MDDGGRLALFMDGRAVSALFTHFDASLVHMKDTQIVRGAHPARVPQAILSDALTGQSTGDVVLFGASWPSAKTARVSLWDWAGTVW